MFHVATGDGSTGDALVRHRAWTTSRSSARPPTGAKVAEACARRLVPIELELGGKSPNLVFEDADLEKAIPAIVNGLLQNAGQSCSAGSRLLVEKTRFEDGHGARGRRRSRPCKIAPGVEDPDLGPLISERQLAARHARCSSTRRPAARACCGGETDALFMKPALVTRVTLDMEIFHEEVFGPVLVAVPFDDERHAVAARQRDRLRARRRACGRGTSPARTACAAGVRAGQVFVNGYGVGGGVELPFGGMGRSGYGRGKGIDALLAYSQVKNVWVALDG